MPEYLMCSFIFHEVRGPLNNTNLCIEALLSHPIVKESADLCGIVSLESARFALC